jgi:hypothetical protein
MAVEKTTLKINYASEKKIKEALEKSKKKNEKLLKELAGL